MISLEGMKNIFMVLKHDDIDKVLEDTPYLGNYLYDLTSEIKTIREQEGRNVNPKYLVINTDESYADEVIEIMKRHGHWG